MLPFKFLTHTSELGCVPLGFFLSDPLDGRCQLRLGFLLSRAHNRLKRGRSRRLTSVVSIARVGREDVCYFCRFFHPRLLIQLRTFRGVQL